MEVDTPIGGLDYFSGDVPSRNVDCTPYAVQILSCFVKGHAGSPAAVTGVMYEVVDRNTIKVRVEGYFF